MEIGYGAEAEQIWSVRLSSTGNFRLSRYRMSITITCLIPFQFHLEKSILFFTGCQANYCSRSLRIVYKIFIKTFKYDKFTKKSQKNVQLNSFSLLW